MLPPDQRLDGQDLAGAQVELRLVVEHELVLVDRLVELLDEPHLVAAPRPGRGRSTRRGPLPSLARYIATSAHQTSRALSVASVGAMAIPMLAPMLAWHRVEGEGLADSR